MYQRFDYDNLFYSKWTKSAVCAHMVMTKIDEVFSFVFFFHSRVLDERIFSEMKAISKNSLIFQFTVNENKTPGHIKR